MVAIRIYVASERNAMNPRDSGWPGASGCATVGRMCPGSNWKFLAAHPPEIEAAGWFIDCCERASGAVARRWPVRVLSLWGTPASSLPCAQRHTHGRPQLWPFTVVAKEIIDQRECRLVVVCLDKRLRLLDPLVNSHRFGPLATGFPPHPSDTRPRAHPRQSNILGLVSWKDRIRKDDHAGRRRSKGRFETPRRRTR
jgi:hypothetical protein